MNAKQVVLLEEKPYDISKFNVIASKRLHFNELNGSMTFYYKIQNNYGSTHQVN